MQSFRRLSTSSAIRTLVRSPIVSSRQFVRRLTQNSGQGGSYASTGRTHGNMGARGSDVPWMIGSVAFTVPAAFYLLSSSPKPAHHAPAGHGHGHATKTTKSEDSDAASMTSQEEEGSSSDEAEATKQVEGTDSKSQDIEEAASDARDQARGATGEINEKTGELFGEAKNKAETSVDGITDTAAAVKEKAGEKFEGMTDELKNKADKYTVGKESRAEEPKENENKVEEVADKVEKKAGEKVGKMSVDEGKEPVDERLKVEKRGNTGETKSQTLERLNREKSEKKISDIDPPAAGMKGPTTTNMQSGKQEGLSNQDTWHPVLHSQRGQAITKKAEGAHQSAKLKGTVDPYRPANYDETKKKKGVEREQA